MERFLLAFFLALFLSFLLTPPIRRLAHSSGSLDFPAPRRIHEEPMPNMGGVAIYLGFLFSVLVFLPLNMALQGLLLGGTVILLVGILDDYRGLSPKAKLLGQVVAASIAVMYGIRIDFITNPLGGLLYTGGLAVPLSIFWIVGITNTINLIDGLDGLASGVGAIASLTIFAVAWKEGQPTIAILAIALSGSCFGFLRYNFYPARIFMGDNGAMFLGYVLASISILGALKTTAAVTLAIPVLALGVPIFDTVFAIVRRHQNGQPIFQSDRGHLHHRLLEMGFSQKKAVLVIYFISMVLGIIAFGINGVNPFHATFFLIFIGLLMVFGARRCGVLMMKEPEQGLKSAGARDFKGG